MFYFVFHFIFVIRFGFVNGWIHDQAQTVEHQRPIAKMKNQINAGDNKMQKRDLLISIGLCKLYGWLCNVNTGILDAFAFVNGMKGKERERETKLWRVVEKQLKSYLLSQSNK